MSTTTQQHRSEAPQIVRAAVITISDTRTLETDTSGQIIVDLLKQAGHEITAREIIPDEPTRLRALITQLRGIDVPSEIPPTAYRLPPTTPPDAIILTGGTGVGSRDQTYEALVPLLTKTLPGFGEIFRMLSYQEIGPAAMLSRAIAGLIDRTVVLALPGSTHAVRLAMEKLIVPELAHLIREARR